MGVNFKEILLRLLLKVSRGRIAKMAGSLDKGVLVNSVRGGIKKLSDEYINQAITDIKKGDFRGYEDIIGTFRSVGITTDRMLKWLEEEKFIREHRKE